MVDEKILDEVLAELIENALDNKDKIQNLQQENEEIKTRILQLMEGNCLDTYVDSAGLYKAQIYAYSKELVNKEKCERMLQALKTHTADVDSIKMSDFTKENKIKFVKVSCVN